MYITNIIKTSDFLFTELGDPRSKNWFLMSNPFGMMCMLGFYLYGIYVYFPKLIEHKKPYKLEKKITVYNIYQIIANLTVVCGIVSSGWLTYDSWICQAIDYSDNEQAMRMLAMCWLYFMIKISDLFETVFFILRKKQNQVSILHVYHHCSTVFLSWISCKYDGGGATSTVILMNGFVHVLMYIYYQLSMSGPNMQKKLKNWKPRLTRLQLVQFVMFILFSFSALKKDCNISNIYLYMFVPNVFINLVLFWNFYYVNYVKSKEL